MRLAFVGQRVFFELCSLEHPADGIEPTFIDFRHDADPRPLRAQLEQLDPDVIWVWRPEIVPPGLLHGLAGRARRLPHRAAPPPRRDSAPRRPHPASRLPPGRRPVQLRPHRLLRPADRPDRRGAHAGLALAADPGRRPHLRDANGATQAVFVGRSTDHRESFLGPAKHDFDVIHVAHGFTGERLIALLRESAIVINLHNEPYPTFENRVPTALAAGALVVSEPLSPDHGLGPSADYIEIETPWDLWRILSEFRRAPSAFEATRASGRREAERFRASTVFPRTPRGPARRQLSRALRPQRLQVAQQVVDQPRIDARGAEPLRLHPPAHAHRARTRWGSARASPSSPSSRAGHATSRKSSPAPARAAATAAR